MPATLPHELCLLILDYLSDEGLKSRCHLLAPALVCHAWTAHAQRQLFRVFSIRSPTDTLLFVAFLARNPRLASYITEIRLHDLHHSLDTTPAPLLAAVFPNVQRLTFCYALSGTDEAYQAMLSAFPAIKNLNIDSQVYVPATSAFSLPSPVGLASLKLRCCMESTHDLLHGLEHTSSSSSLHDISLGLGYREPSFWWVKCVRELTSFTNLLNLHVRLSPYFYPRLLDKVTTRSGTLNGTLLMPRWEANELLW
jgi:hypothetical protein